MPTYGFPGLGARRRRGVESPDGQPSPRPAGARARRRGAGRAGGSGAAARATYRGPLRARSRAPTVAAPEPRTGYSRSKFGDWTTVANNCDTRELVVQRDGTNVALDSQCHATAGRWRSYYDGTIIRNSSKLDIDHIVPLANAWISGARHWTPERRDAFANDLGDPQLIAVSASSNRSKGDSSPDEWKPPRHAARCLYARWWVDVKSIWKLTVTTPEHDALAGMLAAC